jgi:hypothetical protein
MATYYVRKAGNDTTGDGSTGTPWLTVSKALLTISIAGGHTVNIGDGTYGEDTSGLTYLYVNRAFSAEVIFQSESGVAANVILQGSASAAFDVRLNVASNVTFRNLSFTPRVNTNTSAVKGNLGPLTNIKFDGCRFSIEAAGGVSFDQTVGSAGNGLDTISFINCTFVQTGANAVYGLRILTLTSNNAANILISGCTFTYVGVSHPIQIKPQPAQQGTISALTILNTTVSNVGGVGGYGVQLDGLRTATITNLTSSTTGVAGAVPFIIGIDGDVATWASNDVTITGGTFTSAQSHGVLLGAGVDRATISGAKVVGGDQGLVLKSCSNAVARGNTVITSGGAGLLLKGASNSKFEDNTVVNLAGSGLWVAISNATTTSNSSFIRNRVIAQGTSTIYQWGVADDGGGNVSNCNTYALLGTGNYGVILDSAPQTTLAGVRAVWAGYATPGNDSRSRDAQGYQAPVGASVGLGEGSIRYEPAPDCTR